MMDEPPFKLVDSRKAREKAERLYDEVRRRIAGLLPRADIRHIGATSVAGCLTKGDLDLVVRVPADDFEDADRALSRLYLRNDGSVRTVAFSAFEDASRDPHLGVQLVALNGPHDFFHQFAEALKRSPDLLRAYNDLKRAYDGHDMTTYRRAKDAFVEEALADFQDRE